MGNRKSIALVSLGCAKNAVDLQLMAGRMLADGCVLSPDPDRADVVIVNTCSFIASAREEAEAEISRALYLKQRGNYGEVIVAGCYPQRYPEAKGRFPGVDEWLGVPKGWEEQRVPGLRLTGRAFAYLKIAEGCSHKCAYCAIPAIRGPFRSRPMDSILAEAKTLVESGCRELNIVAQDPMIWRDKGQGPRAKGQGGEEGIGVRVKGQGSRDEGQGPRAKGQGGEEGQGPRAKGQGGEEGQGPRVKGRGKGIADLLWALDELDGDYWVRVLYSYPHEITDGFLDWMNRSKHAVKYIDVPLQHTVPEVLERMNRAAAIEATRSASERLRSAVPGVTLRTTIMTGFPGETERRFQMMLDDLRRMRFDRLGAFAFSPEAGTAAEKMSGRPPRRVAEEREREVMKVAKSIWREKARGMIGKTFRALVVAPNVARMESQAPDVDGVVNVATDAVGEFVDVRLEKVRGFDFEGVVV